MIVASRLDPDEKTVQGSLKPLVMFLAWTAPAYALASWRGRDPLLDHALLVRPRDLRAATLVSLALLVAFTLVVIGLAHAVGRRPGPTSAGEIAYASLNWLSWGLLFVALPEEYFFRGVLQPAFDRPGRTVRVLGADLGPGALVSAVAFGLGHVAIDLAVLGSTTPLRAATVFPGLWFAWLRARTGSVLPAAVAHTAANAVGVALFELYAR
jgi:membrane protease YdiL (CAAX protease family)